MTAPRAPYFHFDEKVNDKRRKAQPKDSGPPDDGLSESLTRPSSSSSAGSSTPTLKKLPLDKVFQEPAPNNKHTPRRVNSGDVAATLSSRQTPRKPQHGEGPNSGARIGWKGNANRGDGYAGHHDHLQLDSRSTPPPPPPQDILWEYMDSKGDVHGPYPADKILLWYDSKRFPGFDDSLILRQLGNGSWGSMKAILPQLRWQVQGHQSAPPPPAIPTSYTTPTRSGPSAGAPRVRFALEDAAEDSDDEEFSDLPPHIAARLKSPSDNFDDLPPHLAARLYAKANQAMADSNHASYYNDNDDGPPPGITNIRAFPTAPPRMMSPELDMPMAPPPRRGRVQRPTLQQQGRHMDGGRNMDYRMLSDRDLTMVAESLFLSEAASKWYYMDPLNPRTSEPMNPQQMVDIITLRGLDPSFLIVGVSSAVTMPPSPAFYRPLGGLMQMSLRGEKYRVVTKADMMMDAPGLSWNVVRNSSESGIPTEAAVQDNGLRHDRRRSTDESEGNPVLNSQGSFRKDRRKDIKPTNDAWTGSPQNPPDAPPSGPGASERTGVLNNWASPSTNPNSGASKTVSRTQSKASPFASGRESPESESGVALDMDDILDAHITGQLSACLSSSRQPSTLVTQSSSMAGESVDAETGVPSPSNLRGAGGSSFRAARAAKRTTGLQSWASQVSDDLSRGLSLDASSSLTRDNSLAGFKSEPATTTNATATPNATITTKTDAITGTVDEINAASATNNKNDASTTVTATKTIVAAPAANTSAPANTTAPANTITSADTTAPANTIAPADTTSNSTMPPKTISATDSVHPPIATDDVNIGTPVSICDPMMKPQLTPRTLPEDPKPQPQALHEDSSPDHSHSPVRITSPMRAMILNSPPAATSARASRIPSLQNSSDSFPEPATSNGASGAASLPLLEPPIPSTSPVKSGKNSDELANQLTTATATSASTNPATTTSPADDDASTSALTQGRRSPSSGSLSSLASVDSIQTDAAMAASTAVDTPKSGRSGVPPLRSSVGSLDCKAGSKNGDTATSATFPKRPSEVVFKSLDLKDAGKSRSSSSSGTNSPMGSNKSGSGISQAALARAAVASAMKSQSSSTTSRPAVRSGSGDAADKSTRSGKVSGLAAFFMQQMKQT